VAIVSAVVVIAVVVVFITGGYNCTNKRNVLDNKHKRELNSRRTQVGCSTLNIKRSIQGWARARHGPRGQT